MKTPKWNFKSFIFQKIPFDKLSFILIISSLVKLPYLVFGFGPEEDSWGHIYHIFEMKALGSYVVSRLPGHPLYEGIIFLLQDFIQHPWIFNSISFGFSIWAIILFYNILKELKTEKPHIATWAFALMPTALLSSTYTIDYMIALALMLASIRSMLKENYIAAALFLALATGFRITAMAMLLPLLMYQFQQVQSLKPLVKTAFWAGITAFLLYLPALYSMGVGFFDFHKPPYPHAIKALYKFSLGALGFTGALGTVYALYQWLKHKNSHHSALVLYLSLGIILYLISFWRMPEKAAFALPIYTFLWLIFALQLNPQKLKIPALLLAVSGFIIGINIVDERRGSSESTLAIQHQIRGQIVEFAPFKGLFQSEFSKRINKLEYGQNIAHALAKSPKEGYVVCGWWYAQIFIEQQKFEAKNKRLKLFYLMDQPTFEQAVRDGVALYYLPEMGEVNDKTRNTRLMEMGKEFDY